jgi:hypothetical protein
LRIPVYLRAVATFVACAFLCISAAYWPIGVWHTYLADPALRLPGTSLLRLDPSVTQVPAETLRAITQFLSQNCDTFYSAPPLGSFYIYTGIPSLTGLTVSNSGLYNSFEQREIVTALRRATASGKRVCILREATYYPAWAASSTGRGVLGAEVMSYNREIGQLATYSVWTK